MTPAVVPALYVTVTNPLSFVESANGERNSPPPRPPAGASANLTYARPVPSMARPSESFAMNVSDADSREPVPRIDTELEELESNSSVATRRTPTDEAVCPAASWVPENAYDVVPFSPVTEIRKVTGPDDPPFDLSAA